MDDGALSVSLDVSAIPEAPAGAGRYVVELAKALGSRADVRLTIVHRRGDSSRWAAARPAATIGSVPDPRPARIVYEQWMLGPVLTKVRPPLDVHHGPHYTLPHRLGPIAPVVTIHDMTFFDHPEWHEKKKVPFFRRAIRRSAEQASVIVCVSEATAGRLRAILAPAAPILVAPHAVNRDQFFVTDDAGRFEPAVAAALGERGLRYVLHAGTLEPRKGIPELVAAFASLESAESDLHLVLAGRPGWHLGDITSAIASSGVAARVHMLGFVPDSLLTALYQCAAVVCYPSREEGFGIPALEAMACGKPLVTTAGTAMADFAGDCAWTVRPGQPAELAAALSAALSSPACELARRRELGVERASAFTWERTAEIHADAYRLAGNRAR